MRKPLAIIILMYLFIMPCVLAMGETDIYQIQNGEDDVIMTETLALDTDGPYIILKDYDISYKIGLRFTNINISRGETITEAILSVYCKYDFPNGTGTVTIYGLKVADAPVLDEPEDLSGPLTDSYVIWNISDVKGPDKWHNVTITPIIQEIVNQYGWESGNSLALIILSEKGNIRRQFTSADYMNPAKLYITITPPTPPEENYELITTYKGYEIYNVTSGGLTGNFENFTTYIESDPNNRFDISEYEIIITDINICDKDTYVYKHLDGSPTSWRLRCALNVTSQVNQTASYYKFRILTFSTEVDDATDLVLYNAPYYSIIIMTNTITGDPNTYRLRIVNYQNGNYEIKNLDYNFSINQVYYLDYMRYLTSFSLRVYSDPTYTNKIAEKNYTTSYNFSPDEFMVIVSEGFEESSSQSHSAVLSYLIANFGGTSIEGPYYGESEWHIEIWENGTQVNGNFTSLDDAISYIDNVLIGPEEEPYNPEVGGYEVIPRRIVKLSYLVSGLGLMMMGLIAISYKPTLGRAIMGILMIVLAMGLLIHLTQI